METGRLKHHIADSTEPPSAAACAPSRGESIDRGPAANLLRAARQADDQQRDELTALALSTMPDSRAAMRLRARSLLADRDYEHAHALICRGLLLKPNDVALMQSRAEALLGLNRIDDALEEVRRILRQQPQRIGALVLGGRIALAAGRCERAVMWLTRAHLCRPMCERIKRQLAEALVQSHQADTALELINTLPHPLPLLRAKALRSLGRLREAADVLDMAQRSFVAGSPLRSSVAYSTVEMRDEIIAESLLVAELRGDVEGIERIGAQLDRHTPQASLLAARIDLSRGMFRRALRAAVPFRRNKRHGTTALAIIVAAAGMMQRNRLATRALRHLRNRSASASPPIMHECWRRAMLGNIINDQRNPHRACADPTSSLLQPLLRQAAQTLERRLRRHTAVDATHDAEQLKRHFELCRDALTLQPLVRG